MRWFNSKNSGKIPKVKITNRATRYILEAILIFVSVFAAVLLEAKRSEDFERKMLVKNLEWMIEKLNNDSVKLSRAIRKQSGDRHYMSMNLYNYTLYDSLAIELLKAGENNDLDSVYNLYASNLLLFGFQENSIAISPIYQNTLDDYGNLLINKNLNELIEFYIRERKTYFKLNSRKLEEGRMLESHFINEINIKNQFTTKDDKIKLVNSIYFKNLLQLDHTINNYLIWFIDDIKNKQIPTLKESIEEEIRVQETKIFFK